MSTPLTEAKMSSLLNRALHSGKIRINERPIRNWVTELAAREGVADFVLTPTNISGDRLEWARRLAASISNPASASVLTSLNSDGITTIAEVQQRTSLSPYTIRSTIRALSKGGVIWGEARSGVRPLRHIRESDIELWAYELKLRDWRHGMYQALQYRAFAHSVAIVLPKQAARVITSKLGAFRAYKVGVLLFDAEEGDIRVLVRPTRTRPGSRAHYLFALAGFIRQVSSQRHGEQHDVRPASGRASGINRWQET